MNITATVPAPLLPSDPPVASTAITPIQTWIAFSWVMYFAGEAAIAAPAAVKAADLSHGATLAIDTAFQAFYKVDADALALVNTYIKVLQGGTWPAVNLPTPNLPPDPSKVSTFEAICNALTGLIDAVLAVVPTNSDSGAMLNALSTLAQAITDVLGVVNKNYPKLFS